MASDCRVAFVALTCVLAAGCTPEALGQVDDVRPTIPEACRTEAGCRQLRFEAQRRAARCLPNTVGYERCSDVNADMQEINGRLVDFEHAHAAEALAARRVENDRRMEAAAQERRERDHRRWLEIALADWPVQPHFTSVTGALQIRRERHPPDVMVFRRWGSWPALRRPPRRTCKGSNRCTGARTGRVCPDRVPARPRRGREPRA